MLADLPDISVGMRGHHVGMYYEFTHEGICSLFTGIIDYRSKEISSPTVATMIKQRISSLGPVS